MSIWWCRGCGMEETRPRDACPSCGSALAVAAGLEWLEPESRGEETVWELRTEPVERAAIVEGLISAHIEHRWDSDVELVVPEEHEAAVDQILDEVLGAEEPSEEAGEEADGEGSSEFDAGENSAEESDDLSGGDYEEGNGEDDGYQLLSDLYIATDRVLKSGDELDVSDFGQVVGATLMAPPPFGVDDEKWADIQAAARNSVAALEQDGDDDADPLLHELKALLQEMV